MGKFIKFVIALILICIIVGIVYAYMNVEDVIEYRENKNVNQNEITYNIIDLKIENKTVDVFKNEVKNETKNEIKNNVENKTENKIENRLENLVENNIIENKNLENIVENIMENTVNN